MSAPTLVIEAPIDQTSAALHQRYGAFFAETPDAPQVKRDATSSLTAPPVVMADRGNTQTIHFTGHGRYLDLSTHQTATAIGTEATHQRMAIEVWLDQGNVVACCVSHAEGLLSQPSGSALRHQHRTTKPKYKLADLLAQCQPEDFQLTEDDRAWLNAKPVGKEAW